MGVEDRHSNNRTESNRSNAKSDELTVLEQFAQKHFTEGRFREALENYNRLYRHLPGRLDILARLGYLALLANDLDTAVKHLSQAINLGHRSQRTLTQLAEAYYRLGRLGSAAYCYQRLGREGLAGTLAVMQDLDVYQLDCKEVSVAIPWLTATPLPVIEVQINGRKANMVLDTGAGDTLLDTRLAVDARIRLGGKEHRNFAGGMPAEVTYGHVEELLLESTRIRDIPVQVIDIPHSLADWFPDLPIHGILGTGLFTKFITTLDYQNEYLRLERHDTPAEPVQEYITSDQPVSDRIVSGNPCSDKGAPMWLAENQLLLTRAELPALKQGIWFLDSGMTGGAFAVPGTSVETLGLTVDQSDMLVGTGGGGTLHGHKLRVDWLRLDRRCRHNPDGVMLDSFPLEYSYGFAIQGLIGHDLLRDAVVELDFPTMRLLLTTANS